MIILERFLDHDRETETTKPMGCFGSLFIDGLWYCYTVEQPWRQNRRFVSCVPCGEYDLVHFESNKYGNTVALRNPDLGVHLYKQQADPDERYACLFHAANWSSDLQGCIAPGKDIAWGGTVDKGSNLMVTQSRNTLEKILPSLIDQKLLIRWKHER